MRQTRKWMRAFTLIELLVVLVVIAILAAVIVPKFGNRNLQTKESVLKNNLRVIRSAIEGFDFDCKCYPAALADLAATTAPATGVDRSGNSVTIKASDWRGPYFAIPAGNDPISGSPMKYANGVVSSSAAGNSMDGSAYSSW